MRTMAHRIAGKPWVVVITDTLLDPGDRRTNVSGLCQSSLTKISIRNTDNPDDLWETFWHEDIHASLETFGFQDESENEHLVTALAHCITTILRDNPYMATPDACARVLKGSE